MQGCTGQIRACWGKDECRLYRVCQGKSRAGQGGRAGQIRRDQADQGKGKGQGRAGFQDMLRQGRARERAGRGWTGYVGAGASRAGTWTEQGRAVQGRARRRAG